jgi:iron complex outermembrane receptor protein
LRVKEKWDHEISASYDITDQINIYGGINNLFDQKPAYGYTSYPISAMGQYFYLGARMNFGAGR